MSSRNIQKIARSEAVEDASFSEQLDQRMVVITSYSWLLLVILVVALAMAILWGFLGRIPANITGEGLLIDGNLPVSVKSSKANGSVIEVFARVGSLVEKGQRIVGVDNRELADEIAHAESFLAVLEQQNSTMTTEEEFIFEKQKASVANQVAMANQTIEQTRRLVKMYESEVGDLEVLVEKKLISTTELVQGRAARCSSGRNRARSSPRQKSAVGRQRILDHARSSLGDGF